MICVVLSTLLIKSTVVALECEVRDFRNYNDSTRDCNDVKSLTFKITTWERIPQDLINRTQSIHSIDVSSQGLKSLDNKDFCSWPNLKSINADMNNVTSLISRMFTGCRQLTTLSLSRNNISEIYDDAFHGLSLLSHLDISLNQIHALSDNIFHPLISLKTLSLNNNLIGAIDTDTFARNLNIESLDLSFNMIEVIEKASFWKLKKLATLDISSNPELNSVDLTEMERLYDVILKNDSITSLYIPKYVIKVNADSNKLTQLIIEPNGLLKELSVRHNFIQNIQSVQSANLLTFLDISDNNITDIDFSHLMSTQILQLVILDNPINSFNVEALTSLEHIHSIEISFNSLDNKTLNELDTETRRRKIALRDPNQNREQGNVIKPSINIPSVLPIPAMDFDSKTISPTSTEKSTTPNPASNDKKDGVIRELIKRIRNLESTQSDTSGVHTQMLENVSNLRVMIVCTIVAFSLFVSIQIAIFVSANYKGWHIPNVFSNSNGILTNHRRRTANGSFDPMMEEVL